MLNYNKILLTVIVLISQQLVYGQNKKGFSISGELKGLQDNTLIMLQREKDTVGVTFVKNQRFQFKGFADQEGEPYFIKIDTTSKKYSYQIKGAIRIIMENKPLLLNGDLIDLSTTALTVTGSDSHDDYKGFVLLQNEILRPANSALSKMNLALEKYGANGKRKVDSLYYADCVIEFNNALQKVEDSKRDWINRHRNSLVVPWAIGISIGGEEREKAYAGLTQRAKDSYFGKQLLEAIETERRNAVGAVMTNFEFQKPDGKSLSLKEVVDMSKLTIVDFWASWCKPCRASFPKMKDLYAAYHSKGLNIISYSIDKDESAWLKALTQDNLPWLNIRQTHGMAEEIYGVNTVPSIFLLDHTGKIISNELRGEALYKKVEELLGSK
ncbi:MAG TPA: TlpA disulfide reductase family protein [Pedobacter sp.]|uniref:TlpA disulfide reductase family protein n=1 Tax=Pedobacter sp. TaxID=1411316 RepID=UPI002D1DA680|nr:TlpA disulfide reductase family protein [Pedobacter sp.]HMI03109.1 TlpA disulfide reductase family protein [Pedobacter sp.]